MEINVLLAPKASEASKGAFYLCPGFKWLLLCVSEIGYYCMCVKECGECAMGGLWKCRKFTCSGNSGLLLILIIFQYKSIIKLII